VHLARIRTIKPDFFKNEQVGSLPYQWRLLFTGLWTVADRSGRLEDRPMRIKAELFPYDQVDVNEGLDELVRAGLIVRYQTNGLKAISIPTWARHQLVNRDEAPSQIEGPNGETDQLGRAPNETVRQRIYQRDSFTCVYCKKDMGTDARSRCIDHVIPLARGGSHDERNLVTACKKCNAKKGAKLPDEVGFDWPGDFGHTVNGVTDPRQQGPDKEGEQEKERELVLEREQVRSPEPLRDSEPKPFLEFPIVGKDVPIWPLASAQVKAWDELYPMLDVPQECRSALAWVLANLGRRKTSQGMEKFLVNWLNRAVDNCGGARAPMVTKPAPMASWSCQHVDRCSHRQMCEAKNRNPAKYPVKVAS